MTEKLEESAIVTVLSVVGFIFGLIGMMGSFIPFIGALAFYIGVPSVIISAIALGIAKTKKAKQTFAIVAITIGLIGIVISGWQYMSIMSYRRKVIESINQQNIQQPVEEKKEESNYSYKVIDPSKNKTISKEQGAQ